MLLIKIWIRNLRNAPKNTLTVVRHVIILNLRIQIKMIFDSWDPLLETPVGDELLKESVLRDFRSSFLKNKSNPLKEVLDLVLFSQDFYKVRKF